jgi:hypothetical protein
VKRRRGDCRQNQEGWLSQHATGIYRRSVYGKPG